MIDRVTLVLVLFFAVASQPARADLREDLARRFNAEPRYFILNIPPRPGGWPGSVYTSDMRFALLRGRQDDPVMESGASFDFTADLQLRASAEAGGTFGQIVGIASKASDVAAAAVTFRATRIYELTLPQIRARSEMIAPQDRQPPGPVIVHRAYSGRPTVVLARRSGASAEAWARLKKGLADASLAAEALADDRVQISVVEPVVFAFEVVRVDDLSKVSRVATDPDAVASPAAGATGPGANGGVTGSPGQVSVGSASGARATATTVVLAETGRGSREGSISGLVRVPAADFEAANPLP